MSMLIYCCSIKYEFFTPSSVRSPPIILFLPLSFFRSFFLSIFLSFVFSFFLSFNLFYPHFCLSFLLRPIFISISSSYQFFGVVICCFNSLTSFHNKRKAFSCASPRCFCNLFSCFNVFIMAYKLAITSDCDVIIDFPVVIPWEKLAFFRTLNPLHVL